jgi:ubiquinone/menaquinone biosynthesis C-methylase UbiE
MHFSIDGDLHAQVKFIEQIVRTQLKTGAKVLELGAGNGANSNWLARRNPEIDFLATDLMNLGLPDKAPNHTQILADYHDLAQVPDHSFDAAFAIETVCYSGDLETVFRTVAKKLKPGAPFILFDSYCKEPSQMTDEEKYVDAICVRAMAVNSFSSLNHLRSMATKHKEFELADECDITDAVIPFADYLLQKGLRLLENKALKFRIARMLLPLEIKKNAITAILSSPTLKKRLYVYARHVFVRQ